MFGGRRKRPGQKAEPPKKRKWAVSDSDSDDDEGKKGSDDGGSDDMSCNVCKAEPDVFCLVCKVYFCLTCFAKKHESLEEEEEPPAKKQAAEGSEKEGGGTDAPATASTAVSPEKIHKFRALVGLEDYQLDTLGCGWEQSRSEPQRAIRARKLADQAAKEERQREIAKEVAREQAEKAEEEAKLMEEAKAAKAKADEEYEKTQLEAEMRNKRDLSRGILPRSLGGSGRR
mmetsp:Transcript_13774/g.26704  ORF Transcript_13774/g.26704 Transcript_13774/m.26704 type:complete len:229 (-) Transcript_13774:159-845(-)